MTANQAVGPVPPPAVVLGSSGGFGRVFAELLARQGGRVVGVDVDASGGGGFRTVVSDARKQDATVDDAVAASSWLVVCLPEASALRSMQRLQPVLPPGSLIVDTLSVKTPVATWAAGAREDLQLLSINPLFAPDLPFASRRVATVCLRRGAHVEAFRSLIEAAGAVTVEVSADQHDRETALTQVLVHASLLAVGRQLASTGRSEWRLVTPPFQTLATLVARVAAGDPEVYRHIQADNPYAAEARAGLVRALAEVSAAAESPERFGHLVSDIRASLGPGRPDLESAAKTLFAGLTGPPGVGRG